MLQGKVTKVEWINLHTWVHMDALEGILSGARADEARAATQKTAAAVPAPPVAVKKQ